MNPSGVLFGTLCLGVIFTGCQARSIDLDQLLKLHAEARGGMDAIESVSSIDVQLHLIEPGFEADIRYRALRPGSARVDVSVGGEVVFIEAVNESGAWQQYYPGQPAEPSSPEGTAKLRRGAIGNLYGLHELGELGYRLQLLDSTEIDGARYHTLEVTAPDGYTDYRYLDYETFLVTRTRGIAAVHPDLDPTKKRIENRNSEFRADDGIVRPHREVRIDLDTEEELQRTTFESVKTNVPLDASIFAIPETLESEGSE